MSIGNLNTEGQKRNNFPWQQYMIRLLTSIDNNTAGLTGDNEIVKTAYEAIAPGPGYSSGDNIIRLDIINATTGALVNTLWFNENTQAFIAAPAPGNLVPATAPSDVTVTNPFNLEATQLLVKAVLDLIQTNTLNTTNGITSANVTLNDIENELIALNSTAGTLSLEATQLLVKAVLDAIKLDTANLDVALSTRATEATQLLNNTALLNIFAQLDVDLSTRASEVTLTSLNNKFAAVVRTPTMTRAAGVGSVAAGARSASFYNAGGLAATVLGASLLPGEQISFSAGAEDDTLAVINYDATGTDLLITSIV